MATRQRGKSWMADFMIAGTRYRETFDTEGGAIAWEVATRSASAKGAALPDPGAPRIGGADAGTLGGILRRAKAVHWDRKAGSAKTSMNARIFVEWAGAKRTPADALSLGTAHEFVEHLIEERGVSDSTINRYLSAVSVLTKVAGLPKVELPWRKERNGRKRYFSEAEAAAIVQTLTLWGRDRERDFFVFLLDTGARPYAEAAKLQWGDIRDGRFVQFDATKGGNPRTLPLTERARAAVDRQRSLPEAGAGPWAGMDAWHMIEVWRQVRAHLPTLADTVVYTARHTCASWQVIRGIDIRRVQVWMGHKNIGTTLIYAHLSPSHLMDNLRALEGPSASAPPQPPMLDVGITLNREPAPIAPDTPKPSQRTSPRSSPWAVPEQLE